MISASAEEGFIALDRLDSTSLTGIMCGHGPCPIATPQAPLNVQTVVGQCGMKAIIVALRSIIPLAIFKIWPLY